MSNQTLVHNMRCQNQLQWGRTGNQEKKEGNATSHTSHSRVHTEFTQNGGEHLKHTAALCGYENI